MLSNKISANLLKKFIISFILSGSLLIIGYSVKSSSAKGDNSEKNTIVGAWKGKVQFKNGAFEKIKDLEFLYVFNKGGTMTESSNYDGVPPVPPAYGIWKKNGENKYEAKYIFFLTRPPKSFDEITSGGGWMPAGYGVLLEHITLSTDGKSFTSLTRLDLFDQSGNTVDGGGDAETTAAKFEF